MKGRRVVIGRLAGREIAALWVDGRLQDLLVAPPSGRSLPGAIYRGVAGRPMKGLGGTTVRLPEGAGFLREARGLAEGASVLVQVTGHAEPGKAPPVSRRLVLKGRLAMVTPGAPGANVSRAIADRDARARLQDLAARLDPGGDDGLVLRTAAAEADEAEIAAEVALLTAEAAAVADAGRGGPAMLREAPGPAALARRDWAATPAEVEEGPEAVDAAELGAEIAALSRPDIALPGGGTLWVEPARACVAVDVDTGPETAPAAGLKATIAAFRDLPRALRLRGLGGQVVVDPAPLAKRDRPAAEAQLRRALADDPVQTAIVGWTTLGHLELQRRRERLPLADCLPLGEFSP